MVQAKNLDVYNATIKLFGSEPLPAFEDPSRLERLWGRNWGCSNDVGQIRAVLMHRPGDEFNIIDRSKRIAETNSFASAGPLGPGIDGPPGEVRAAFLAHGPVPFKSQPE